MEDSLKNRLIGLGYRLYNNYGPTEITVDALSSKCSGDVVHLGRPIANTSCYVLDNDGGFAAVGVKGELCIAGAGVSRGYLNDPELTAEKFIMPYNMPSATRNPFEKGFLDFPKLLFTHHSPLTTHHSPLYKTGDLVRWLPGGKLEFIGRKDQQVKIRGYRIEPGEIETQIKGLADIQEVVVVDREKAPGEQYLCAYFVSGSVIEVSELKKSLSKKLPEYMMPLYYIQLEKMPRKANGKIDSNALPEPGSMISGIESYMAPRDEMEEKLAGVWAEVLGLEAGQVGIDGNFFQLGGHSLKAAALTSKIHREMNINVPLAEIFRLPSIRDLAGYMKQVAGIFTVPAKNWKGKNTIYQ